MSTNSSWPTRRARPPAWTSLWPSCRPSTPSRRRPKGARSRAWVLAIAVVLPNDGERSSNHNSLITSAILSGVATEIGPMNLLLIPLDEAIIFPAVTATLPIDPGDEERVFLLPRRDSEFGRVGVVAEILELRGADDRIAAFLRSVEEPGALADTAGYSPDLSPEQKLRLLETLDVKARLELAVEMQHERLAELQVRVKIRDDVESGAQKQQREYFLRKQMESIRKELGEDEGDLIAEYERKNAEAEMPEAVAEQADRELRRLERQGEQSPESSMIRSYLDWLLAVPW